MQNQQEETLDTGIVFRRSPGLYTVKADSGAVICSISNRLRKILVYPYADPSSRRRRVDKVEDIKSTDPVAIGDRVNFVITGDGTGMITEVLPRKNKLNRHSSKLKEMEQVIVANVDQVVVVSQAERANIYWSLMDAFIADCEAAEIPAVVCVTKMDVADDDIMDGVKVYTDIGYPVILTSVIDNSGMDEFRGILKGKVSVFIGKSGVGKSSLLNYLEPGLGLKTKEVSETTKKGRHATSHFEMFPVDIDGMTTWIVDTPGMRKFGIWESGEYDIAYLFREMRPFIGQCRFGYDCTHTHEPGCAIKKAIEDGEITERRYSSYLKMSN